MNQEKGDEAIDLYTWSTPNGRKVSIMLEELGVNYRVFAVDIGQGEQHEGEIARINPNHKIPAIVDHEHGISLMESAAILMYLAKKYDRFMSLDGDAYWHQMQWLMFQVGHIGPMLGQAHHFLKFNPGKSPYAEARYEAECARLYSVLDARLQSRDYLCDDYTIVDITTWPWISRFEWQQIDLTEYPSLCDWYIRIAGRPAVQRGYAVPQPLTVPML